MKRGGLLGWEDGERYYLVLSSPKFITPTSDIASHAEILLHLLTSRRAKQGTQLQERASLHLLPHAPLFTSLLTSLLTSPLTSFGSGLFTPACPRGSEIRPSLNRRTDDNRRSYLPRGRPLLPFFASLPRADLSHTHSLGFSGLLVLGAWVKKGPT